MLVDPVTRTTNADSRKGGDPAGRSIRGQIGVSTLLGARGVVLKEEEETEEAKKKKRALYTRLKEEETVLVLTHARQQRK